MSKENGNLNVETEAPPPYSNDEQQTSTRSVINVQPPCIICVEGSDGMYISARTSKYGPLPVEMDCPHCEKHIITHIERLAGALPWILCGIFVIAGFFLLLIPWLICCLPFYVDKFMDVVHTCPACRRMLGRYRRM